jgi:hypothetical protein
MNGDTLNVECFDNFSRWEASPVVVGSDELTEGSDDPFDINLGFLDLSLNDLDVFCWWSCDKVEEDPWWMIDDEVLEE